MHYPAMDADTCYGGGVVPRVTLHHEFAKLLDAHQQPEIYPAFKPSIDEFIGMCRRGYVVKPVPVPKSGCM